MLVEIGNYCADILAAVNGQAANLGSTVGSKGASQTVYGIASELLQSRLNEVLMQSNLRRRISE